MSQLFRLLEGLRAEALNNPTVFHGSPASQEEEVSIFIYHSHTPRHVRGSDSQPVLWGRSPVYVLPDVSVS